MDDAAFIIDALGQRGVVCESRRKQNSLVVGRGSRVYRNPDFAVEVCGHPNECGWVPVRHVTNNSERRTFRRHARDRKDVETSVQEGLRLSRLGCIRDTCDHPDGAVARKRLEATC
jgi:hypothetical protein